MAPQRGQHRDRGDGHHRTGWWPRKRRHRRALYAALGLLALALLLTTAVVLTAV